MSNFKYILSAFVILFIIGLVTWIGWHIWCAKWETNYHDEKIQQYGSSQNLKDAIDSD